MHPAGRFDRQHGAGKPRANAGLRAETPLAPQDGRPQGTVGHDVGGLDPGDIRMGPQGRPRVVDAFAYPSHPEISRPDALGQEFAEPGPVGEEGAVEAPGPHFDVSTDLPRVTRPSRFPALATAPWQSVPVSSRITWPPRLGEGTKTMARSLRTIHSHQVRSLWGRRVSSAGGRGAEGGRHQGRGHRGEGFPRCLAKGVDAADADRYPRHLPHDR